MAQIFHRSANTLSRVTIFGAVFIVAFVLWVIGGIVRSPTGTDQGIEREQPVPFSHQHHVSGLGIDCRSGTTTSRKRTSPASRPSRPALNATNQSGPTANIPDPVRAT